MAGRGIRFTNRALRTDRSATQIWRSTGPFLVKTVPFCRRLNLLQRLPVGVDLVDLAQIQLANARLDLAQVSYHDPQQMIRQDVLLRYLVGVLWRQGQHFLRESVVVVFRQAVLEDVAISAAELLHGLKVSGQ